MAPYEYQNADMKLELLIGLCQPQTEITTPLLEFLKSTRDKAPGLLQARCFKLCMAFPVPSQHKQNTRIKGLPLAEKYINEDIYQQFCFIQFASREALAALQASSEYLHFIEKAKLYCKSLYVGVFENTMSYKTVSTDPSKYYLFNFFTTDTAVEDALSVWRQTSGWFYDHTACLSSYNMKNLDSNSGYRLVNFAHWNSLWRLFLNVAFIRHFSFKKTVMHGFWEHRLLTKPLLYREINLP